jgi:GNAT superfamily N-acetyltransferase
MFHVEKMAAKDFPFAVELANTMNWSMTKADFAFNAKLEPHGCFVLLCDQKRIGVATCINYGRIGWFGNLVVNENYRGKGAGTLLVKHAIKYLESTGVTTIGLYAYEHLINFYANLGFKKNSDFVVLKAKKAKKVEEEKQATMKKRDLPALVNFDCQCFGASREKLLTQIVLRKGNVCFVSKENGEVNGYVAAKIYGEMAEVGPLVTCKNHSESAVTLLRHVLARVANLEAFMCLPASETELLKTAVEAGFQKEFLVARMFLGPAVAENCVHLAESLERG